MAFIFQMLCVWFVVSALVHRPLAFSSYCRHMAVISLLTTHEEIWVIPRGWDCGSADLQQVANRTQNGQ